METPRDLVLQSSTWSNYKLHNTAKYLVEVTPNGAISLVSPAFVGSISDPERTRCSGLLSKLEGKWNISVMADRGFTIRDQLDSLGIGLNIPPFLDGQKQLPPEKVQEGRSIACPHTRGTCNWMDEELHHSKRGFPITLASIANQILTVCAYLTNFLPPLVPSPTNKASNSSSESDLDIYYSECDNNEL